MIPIDLELFKTLLPLVVVVWAIIFFLWSKVEHPLMTLTVNGRSDDVFEKLRGIISEKPFSKLEENRDKRKIRIKGVLKIVDVVLYRCWSQEIIFRVEESNPTSSKIIVACRPSPFRFTASRTNPHYFTRESLNHLVKEVAAENMP